MNAIERKPKSELAHATPRLLYIAVAKRGKAAPKDDRIKSASGILRLADLTQRCMTTWTNRYQRELKPHTLGKRLLRELMLAKRIGSIV